MIKIFLFQDAFLAKAIRIFLAALLLNTLLLLAVHFENIASFLNSVVNFSLTIGGQTLQDPQSFLPLQPQKPQNMMPANNADILLPFTFAANPFRNDSGVPHQKSIWIFRRADGIYEPPVFRVESMSADGFNLTNFNLQQLDIFQPGQTYFWRVKYIDAQNRESAFSDETNFIMRVLAQITVAESVVSSGGGGGYSSPPIVFVPPSEPIISTPQIIIPPGMMTPGMMMPGMMPTPAWPMMPTGPMPMMPTGPMPMMPVWPMMQTAPTAPIAPMMPAAQMQGIMPLQTAPQTPFMPVSQIPFLPQQTFPKGNFPAPMQQLPQPMQSNKQQLNKPQPKGLPQSRKSKTPKIGAKKSVGKQSVEIKPSIKESAKIPPPVNVKLKNKKIKKGEQLQVEIKQVNPKKSSARAAKKVDVSIKKKGSISDIHSGSIKIDRKSAQAVDIKETKNLGVGAYIAVLSFVEADTLYAFSESFEVVPDIAKREPLISLLMLNEAALSILLLTCTSLFYWQRRH